MFDFWHALALAANWHDAGEADRAEWLTELRAAQARFDTLAGHCAQNFRCQALLLAAEIARVEDRDDALALYGQAIEFADIHPLLSLGALANELCGRHLVRTGKSALARMHLAQARAGYVRWGAHAKVQAMQTQYPILAARGSSSSSVPASTGDNATRQTLAATTPEGGLDLYSVVKAAQAIAGETQVDGLLSRLMRIAIENAGAQRGALILETESGPMVHAVGGLDSLPAAPALPLEQASSVPMGIVNYVRRTSMSLVLTRSDIDEHHASDPYVAHWQPRSVMCVPAQHQGRLVGVLYLENRQVSGAFTADRTRVLHSLAAQAAIALENARLHRELEAENSFLRRDLIANVSHDLRTPLVSIRGYLELLAATGESLDDTQRRSYLETAVRQSEHLGVLIDELFELAKLDFKGLALQCEEFQIGELASDVLQKFQLDGRGQTDRTGTRGDAGTAGRPRRLESHRARARQPARQRAETHAGRRLREGAPAGRRTRCGGERDRQRRGHCAGRPAAHLRPVLPRAGRVQRPIMQRTRHGTRSGDCETHP